MFMRLRHLLGWVLWRHFPKFTKGQEKEMMEMKLKTGTGTTADTAAEEVIPKGRSFSDQLRATSGGGRSDSSYYVITPGVPAIWELTPRYGRMNVVKSVVPYRQCSAGRTWAGAMEVGGALSIGRFAVSR